MNVYKYTSVPLEVCTCYFPFFFFKKKKTFPEFIHDSFSLSLSLSLSRSPRMFAAPNASQARGARQAETSDRPGCVRACATNGTYTCAVTALAVKVTLILRLYHLTSQKWRGQPQWKKSIMISRRFGHRCGPWPLNGGRQHTGSGRVRGW